MLPERSNAGCQHCSTGIFNGGDRATTIQEVPGTVPVSGGSTACTIDEPQFKWVSYFKGSVWGYNKAKNVSFVIFVPEDAYKMVESMVAGNNMCGSLVLLRPTELSRLQFENARIGDRKLQVPAEYFNGPSPNGQFYTQNTTWFGLGVHLYY